MTTLTLLVKASNFGQVKQLDELLKSQFEDLDVQVAVSSTPSRWVQASVSGEDQAIAASWINKEIGTCPINLENAKNQPNLKGYISKLDFIRQELVVDVGIFEPNSILAAVPLTILQSQLAGGQKADLTKISEVYRLVERLPISVRLLSVDEAGGLLEAELSLEQVERLVGWRQSLLDRLIVLGASRDTVERVLERTRLTRDVIGIENLGMFEHALACKFGTDAAGLISIVGRYLRHSVLVAFSARKNIDYPSEQGLTL